MKWLKNNKGKIISVIIICIVLAFAYFADEKTVKNETNTASTEVFKGSSFSETTEPYQETLPVVNEETLPEYVAEESVQETDGKAVCTLSVDCSTIIQNMERLEESKRGIMPSDGIIFKQNILFEDGESAFDVLVREMHRNNIHFEYVDTPMYNSTYIEGINNIYEFDCGNGSGWLYRVNGVFPNCGSSQYKIKNGDVIEFVYTCNMGKDVGKN